MGEAALQAGNSESIIRRHYLDLKSAKEAKAFWSIRPTRVSNENVIKIPVSPSAESRRRSAA